MHSLLISMFSFLLLAIILPEVTASDRQTTVVVTAVFSQKSLQVEDSLQTVKNEIRQEDFPHGTRIHVRPYLLEDFSQSFFYFFDSFYGVIKSGDISMVVVLEDLGRVSRIVPWLCSMWGIPVFFAYESQETKLQVSLYTHTIFHRYHV